LSADAYELLLDFLVKRENGFAANEAGFAPSRYGKRVVALSGAGADLKLLLFEP
jgi:hypothetical protein